MKNQKVIKKRKQSWHGRRSLSARSRLQAFATLLFFLCLIMAKMLFIGDEETASTAMASINHNYDPPSLAELLDSDSSLEEAPPLDGSVKLTGSLRDGDNLETALRRADVPAEARQTIISSLAKTLDFKKLRPEDTFTATINRSDDLLLDFTYDIGPLESYQILRDGDEYAARRLPVHLEKRVEYIEGTVSQSLLWSLQRDGEQPEVAHVFADIFASKVDFNTELHPGDRYRIIVEKMYKGDVFVLYGKMLFASYQSKITGRDLIAYRFAPEGRPPAFFDENGEDLLASFIRSPIPMAKISSGFTTSRMHPILGFARSHLGIDLAAPTGTPVMAAADGKVVFVGYNGDYGNQIIVQHSGGYRTHYSHLSGFRPGMKNGAEVRQKEVIGRVGSTGLSTGPHLDYRMDNKGAFINPFSLKVLPKSVLKGSTRNAFLAQKKSIDGMLATASKKSPVLHASRLILDGEGRKKKAL